MPITVDVQRHRVAIWLTHAYSIPNTCTWVKKELPKVILLLFLLHVLSLSKVTKHIIANKHDTSSIKPSPKLVMSFLHPQCCHELDLGEEEQGEEKQGGGGTGGRRNRRKRNRGRKNRGRKNRGRESRGARIN